jgi:hypothetical protein|tara:strand:- start:310 stop:561 length:252 start_codon:yes stop_codon:yes gene_type:complete
MRQQDLTAIVEGLKAEFSNSPRLNRKSVADRATAANLAALDLMLESSDADKGAPARRENAKTLKALSHEFVDVSTAIRSLSAR